MTTSSECCTRTLIDCCNMPYVCQNLNSAGSHRIRDSTPFVWHLAPLGTEPACNSTDPPLVMRNLQFTFDEIPINHIWLFTNDGKFKSRTLFIYYTIWISKIQCSLSSRSVGQLVAFLYCYWQVYEMTVQLRLQTKLNFRDASQFKEQFKPWCRLWYVNHSLNICYVELIEYMGYHWLSRVMEMQHWLYS